MKNKHKGHPAVQWERGDWMYPINEPPPKKNRLTFIPVDKRDWPFLFEFQYSTPTQHINQPRHLKTPKLEALLEWMDALVLHENRDERELFSLWQNIRTELRKGEE